MELFANFRGDFVVPSHVFQASIGLDRDDKVKYVVERIL